MIIYKITNKINGKVYIGQTTQSLSRRWRQHCDNSKSKCYMLKNAIQKYGKENFTVEQIDVACDRDELDKKEQYWIQYYNSINPEKVYNLTSGGKHCEISDEVKKHLSDVNKGSKPSEQCILNSIKSRKGKKLSKEHIEKLRKTRIGELNGMFGKKRPDLAKINVLKRKPVICIETGNVFDSIAMAALYLNKTITSVSHCLCGRSKTCGGYHWRYL